MTSHPNCLIVDDMHPSLFPLLEAAGISCDYQPQITREQVLEVISHYQGVVVRSKFKIDKQFLSAASQLRYIARAGSGKDNIDVPEADKRGIAILNAPEGNRDAVAEHTIGLLLNLLNKICIAHHEVKNRTWKREANRGTELGGKIVGILGYGNTGRAVSKRLVSFGCQTLAYDIHGISQPEAGVTSASMEQLFENADILTIHIPLDSRNRYLVDKSFLNRFKKPIWLINTARGEIVNTLDLIAALRENRVLGAGLDVLENEKLENQTAEEKQIFAELTSLPSVILTPHVAGWTHESYRKISEVLGTKISSFYKNKDA